MPLDGFEIDSVAVSVPSNTMSSTTVNVTDPAVIPFGIVIVVLLSV